MLWPPARLRLWLQTWTPPCPTRWPHTSGSSRTAGGGNLRKFLERHESFSKKHDSLLSPPSRPPPPKTWGREALGRVRRTVWERCLHFGSCVCLGLLTAWSIRGIHQAGTRCDCAGRDTSQCLLLRETAIQWDYWQRLKTDRNTFRRCTGVTAGNDNCFCAGWRYQLLLTSSQDSLVPFQVPLQQLLPGDSFYLWKTIPMWKKQNSWWKTLDDECLTHKNNKDIGAVFHY